MGPLQFSLILIFSLVLDFLGLNFDVFFRQPAMYTVVRQEQICQER